MGKNDFLTPKAIANRIKSKGLQKLRWYCQLCQKQCRDENGFKCHQLSESHRRQMDVFGLNPERVVEGLSEEFEAAFMDHLRRAHPFSRVLAKNVYNEYIQDKHHVHMNSTKWLTLTEFVAYLGRTGQCKVEETEKGWYITLIQEDPMKKLADEKRVKREAHEREEEERQRRYLAQQAARAEAAAAAAAADRGEDDGQGKGANDFDRSQLDGPLVLGLSLGAKPPAGGAAASERGASDRHKEEGRAGGLKRPLESTSGAFGDEDDEGPGPSGQGAPPKKLSKVEELMQRDLQAKARAAAEARKQATASAAAAGGSGKAARLDHWLHAGIVVKVMSPALKAHGYYKQKGTVLRVIDRYLGEIEMADSGDLLRVDQAELETVIPSPGGAVLVVNGPQRGARGTLVEIDVARFQAKVKLSGSGSGSGGVWFEYEDVSKLAA